MICNGEIRLLSDESSLRAYLEECVESSYEIADSTAVKDVLSSAENALESFYRRWNGNNENNANAAISRLEKYMSEIKSVLITKIGRKAENNENLKEKAK